MTEIQYGKPNIFVSYAHVDDEPMPGEPEGRVTTLVRIRRTTWAKSGGPMPST